jgi:hypothetical protein
MFIDKGAVGVDVFFVISGLVIFLSTEGKLLVVAALLFAVCQAWTGYGWVSEFYRSGIVYEFQRTERGTDHGVHVSGALFREQSAVQTAW